MEDYQNRVVEEKKELDIKIDKLGSFLYGDKVNVVASEAIRMGKQLDVMKEYSVILADRISNFK